MSKKPNAIAEAMFNGDFYRIIPMSQGMLSYAEPSASPQYLDPYADDESLGKAVREALSHSKRVSIDEFQNIFHSGIIQKNADERNALAMKEYGYKTKRAMWKKMDSCGVAVFDDRIEIQPTHQKSLDSYTANKTEGPFPLDIPTTASDAELGAVLREGFKRCTSAIR